MPYDRAQNLANVKKPVPAQRSLARLVVLSQLALLWERVWPALGVPCVVLGCFALLSLTGVWVVLPPGCRVVLALSLGTLFLLSLIPLGRVRPPERSEARARLDRSLPGRVLSTLEDAPVAADPFSQTLWQSHLASIAAQSTGLRLQRPHPRAFVFDRWGVRFLLVLLLALAVVRAGPQTASLLLSAWDGAPNLLPPPRLDAWLAPPGYTGRAVLPLPLDAGPGGPRAVSVPAGSVFHLHTQSARGLELKLGLRVAQPQVPPPSTAARVYEVPLHDSTTYRLLYFGRVLAEGAIDVVPDNPPQISLLEPPQPTPGLALRVKTLAQDDYGVTAAQIQFLVIDPLPPRVDFRLNPARKPQPLVDPPRINLQAQAGQARRVESVTVQDLTAHPYAGLRARLMLVARDAGGNVTRADGGVLTLPARPFAHPLAAALVDLRQRLARDRQARDDVSLALDALRADPEAYEPDRRVILQLSALQTQLDLAHSDDDLRAVLDRLWALATNLEAGALSDAERALQQAQDRLEDAIRRGADAGEIARLMNDLRQAMATYLQQLQQQQASNQNKPRRPSQTLRPQDLAALMKRLEDFAKSGARASAQAALQQLRDLMAALRNSAAAGAASPLQDKLDELGGLMREQQELMDKTFRARNAPPGTPQDVQRPQDRLREKMDAFNNDLKDKGAPNMPGLDDAAGAMGSAGERLQQNDFGAALGPQGQALDHMRRGARALQKALRGEGQWQGPGEQGAAREDGAGRARNPFGSDDDELSGGRVPGAAERQSLQDLRDELKRRLATPDHSAPERDYWERLLKAF